MADDTDRVLRQADALIRRSRVFVAGAEPRVSPAANDDDLPTLTEIVSDREAALAVEPQRLQQRIDTLREELSRWLETELPDTVLKLTDGLGDRLMADLTENARTTLLPRLIARLEGNEPGPESEA